MLPIVLQNLLSAVVSTADVLMLTHVSQAALSASSLAGQVNFVLTLFYFGLSTGASVMAAQYWGKGDTETIGRVQGLALRYSCVISLLFFLAALLMPERLMGTFIADLVLQILSVVAQSERENIKKRQAEGIAAARARGVHLGRPAIPAPEGFDRIVRDWEHGKITTKDAIRLCGMSEGTFYRRRREMNVLKKR